MPGLSQACWDCGFEPHRRHGSLSFVSVLCRQVEVSATGWSLVRKNPTGCGVSECNREASTKRTLWPTRVIEPRERTKHSKDRVKCCVLVSRFLKSLSLFLSPLVHATFQSVGYEPNSFRIKLLSKYFSHLFLRFVITFAWVTSYSLILPPLQPLFVVFCILTDVRKRMRSVCKLLICYKAGV